MGDSHRRAALERQKALIEEHLRWLEQELAELEQAPEETTSSSSQPPGIAPASESRDSSPTSPAEPAEPAFVPAPTREEAEPTESGIDALPREYVRDQQDTGQQAKLGCGIALAIAIGLALFFLFGLPFLIYD
jgi:hypothetical protein